MATKLFLKSTRTNGLGDSTYFDMTTTAGAGSSTAVVNTVASGTNIPWTQTAGGSVIRWVSGRVPAGGFTLTTTDISIWAHESGTAANAGGRYRLYKRAPSGVETELGGGPFDDGVEFTKSTPTEMTWAGNVTDTAFAENDRLVLEVDITNVGTMGGSQTCTLTYDAADGSTGDSFLNLNETVTFKAEATFLDTDNNWHGDGCLPETVGRFARVAMASAMFTASLAAGLANVDQGENVPQPPQFDEDYWQNWVAPVPARNYIQLPYLPDPEEIPAGSLIYTPCESHDYWQVVQPEALFRRCQFQDDSEFIIPPAGLAEEDYWSQPRPRLIPQAIPLFFLTDASQSYNVVTGPPDEDYWGVPGQHLPPDLWVETVFLPYPMGAGDDVFFAVTEEYWQNPVFPVPATLRWPQQWPFEMQEIFTPVTARPEEDFWSNPVPSVPSTLRPLNPSQHQDDPGGLFGQYDEDFWQNPVAPVPLSLIPLSPFPEQGELPPVPVEGIDEDYWQNSVSPVTWLNLLPRQWEFDQQETAVLFWSMEEDFWVNPVPPVQARNYFSLPYLPETEENIVIPITEIYFDEDFWVNPVAPELYVKNVVIQQGMLDEREPGTPVLGIPDEDYWINPVFPEEASLLYTQQWCYEMEDWGLGSGGTVVSERLYPQNPYLLGMRLLIQPRANRFRRGRF